MTEVSGFDNWKLQHRTQVSASVLVDCDTLSATPDSFLPFFVLLADSFANNFDFLLSNEGVNFCSEICRVCMENTHFPLKYTVPNYFFLFNWCHSLAAVYFRNVGRKQICFHALRSALYLSNVPCHVFALWNILCVSLLCLLHLLKHFFNAQSMLTLPLKIFAKCNMLFGGGSS